MRNLQTYEARDCVLHDEGVGGEEGGIIFQRPIIEKTLIFKTVSTRGGLLRSTKARNKTIILWLLLPGGTAI